MRAILLHHRTATSSCCLSFKRKINSITTNRIIIYCHIILLKQRIIPLQVWHHGPLCLYLVVFFMSSTWEARAWRTVHSLLFVVDGACSDPSWKLFFVVDGACSAPIGKLLLNSFPMGALQASASHPSCFNVRSLTSDYFLFSIHQYIFADTVWTRSLRCALLLAQA